MRDTSEVTGTPTARSAAIVLAAVCVYITMAIPAAIRNADQINPDGISYIRLGQYLAEGRFYDSVSGCWSPLISWSMAPLLALGVDGLYAARTVLVVWGAMLVAASALLTKRFAISSAGWRLAALVLIGGVATHWAVKLITPDVLLAACLVTYLYCVAGPRLLESRGQPFAAGLLGGLSYLAKAYALPFFLVHFSFVTVLRYFCDRGAGPDSPAEGARTGPRRVVRAWVLGIVGFGLVAGPWVGVLSWKYGHLTFSSAGRINHTVVGPPDVQRFHPMKFRLYSPPAGHISVWEVPEMLPYRRWSPLENVAYLKHQLKQAARNLWDVRRILSEFDAAGLSLCVVGLSPVLMLVFRRRRHDLFRIGWVTGTVVFYCCGFLLVYVERRYIEPVLWPVACLLCFHLALMLRDRLLPRAGEGAFARKAGKYVIAAVTIGAFAVGSGARVAVSKSAVEYRSMGRQLAETGCEGPVAGTKWEEGLFLAYHVAQPFVGTPESRKREECERELDEHGVRTFLVWRNSHLSKPFAESLSWTLATTITDDHPGSGGAVDVYIRKHPRADL